MASAAGATDLESWRGARHCQGAINLSQPFHHPLKGFGGAGAWRIRSWWLPFSKYIVLWHFRFIDPFESLMNVMSTSLGKKYKHTHTILLGISRDLTTSWIPSYETLLEVLFLCGHPWPYRLQCRKPWMVESGGPGCFSGSVLISRGLRVTRSLSVKWDINAYLAGGLKSVTGKALMPGSDTW